MPINTSSFSIRLGIYGEKVAKKKERIHFENLSERESETERERER